MNNSKEEKYYRLNMKSKDIVFWTLTTLSLIVPVLSLILDLMWLIAASQIIIGFALALLRYSDSKSKEERINNLGQRVDDTGMSIIDNVQYLYVIIDKDKHFLFGIEKDGSVDWSKGIPQPIKDELNKIKLEIEYLKSSSAK